jgi:chromosome segregation ATPase
MTMVSLKNLLGHDVKMEELPAELRAVLTQLRHERANLEAATLKAQDAAQQLSHIQQPVAEAQKVVLELQTRIKALERLVPVLATLDQETETVSRTQRHTEKKLEQMADEAKGIHAEIEQLRGALDTAFALKGEVQELLELSKGFKPLRGDADALTCQLRDLTQGFERSRQRHDELHKAGEAAVSRLQSIEERQQQLQATVASSQTRLTGFDQAFAHLTQAAADAAETRHQLGTLKALGDYVSQKVAALEEQRAVVDRALGQASQLSGVLRDIDDKIAQHQTHARTLQDVGARVVELQAQHADLIARTRDIASGHDEIANGDRELRGRLSALRDEVQRNVKRFELEHEGLNAVEQRIIGLRGALSDLETRFQALDESARVIGDVRSRADGLAGQVGHIADQVAELEPQAAGIASVRADAERLAQTVAAITERTQRLEKTQPTVEAALADFATLKGTHEAVRDAAERLRVTEGEIARARDAQSETKTWLDGVTESVSGLRDELAKVEALKPTVAAVRTEAERVSQSVSHIEARRELVQQLHERVSELTVSAAQLEERTRGIALRMDSTDEQFQALTAHADEAARIEKLVPSVLGSVEQAERRLAEIDGTMRGLETRSQSVERLAEETAALGREIDQRRVALQSATEHLERASELRAEAGQIAQQLEERAKQLNGTLVGAADRTAALGSTIEELEGRAGNLRFIQKRMTLFEERLAKWHALEEQLTRALDQASSRQATVDALQADLHRLFDVAEQTVDHVRSIAGAKEQVSETQAMLVNVLDMVHQARDAAGGLEQRKRQVEQAEERLARVEALLADMESSVESLRGQKTFLDQVIEKAGTLEYYAKQAEALVTLLRDTGVDRPRELTGARGENGGVVVKRA